MKGLLIFILGFVLQIEVIAQSGGTITPHKRQFRAAWMATVRNLDWPSKPGLSVRKQKKEFIKQIETLQALGMNVVIVQIRPIADSFYPSEFEPWSEFLTGKQGVPPKGSFDPLEFMINETHNRAMEFHAWFNPYRAARNGDEAELSPDHAYNKHPEWFVEYGKGIYFDPGMEPARKFVEKVIADVVTRYDIDAVHFDDYYYPYRIEGLEFPDTLSFSQNPRGFTIENKDDWRRDNINLLVQELYDTINVIKPWVHFGISPFGVWRNKSKDPEGSDTHTIQTNYDDLYGDAIAWMKNGWLDYILPQCYQYLGRDIMDYRVVTRWWNDHNYGVNFYIGQGPFRLGNPERGEPWTIGNEIERQLYFNDSIPNLLGSAYFKSTTFLENPLGVNDILKNKFYAHAALPPVSHHDMDKTFTPDLNVTEFVVKKRKIEMAWDSDDAKKPRYYIIYQSENIDDPKNIVAVTAGNSLVIKRKLINTEHDVVALTAVDRYRKESQPVIITIK
ncbi:MAG: family 10 glycosylhydrolase [Bacteroidota bacterium]